MPKRDFKLTRLELKRQRDRLSRFSRYVPTLKLKQQQLQITLLEVRARRRKVRRQHDEAKAKFEAYDAVLADRAGLNVRELGQVAEVKVDRANIAGVDVPEFREAVFVEASYSLFATPAWVDRALADLRELRRAEAEMSVLDEKHRLLAEELTRIIQRVNLFEKVLIPKAAHAIRVIRIHLGDMMTAQVARAKIAKAKLQAMEHEQAQGATP